MPFARCKCLHCSALRPMSRNSTNVVWENKPALLVLPFKLLCVSVLIFAESGGRNAHSALRDYCCVVVVQIPPIPEETSISKWRKVYVRIEGLAKMIRKSNENKKGEQAASKHVLLRQTVGGGEFKNREKRINQAGVDLFLYALIRAHNQSSMMRPGWRERDFRKKR